MADKHTINTSYTLLNIVLLVLIGAVSLFFLYPQYTRLEALKADNMHLQEAIQTIQTDKETLATMPQQQKIAIDTLPMTLKKSDISAYFEVYGLCIEKLQSLMNTEYLTFERITFGDSDTKTAAPLHTQLLILEGTASQKVYYELLESLMKSAYPSYFERTPYINELSKSDIEYLKTHPLPALRIIESDYKIAKDTKQKNDFKLSILLYMRGEE